jgi:16S rRNA (guanine(966)-N(2))-methyltransferase RsmD
VRPTSDRLRETLFNVLGRETEEARFLDLCAGSGAVGIEAVSRGASHVTLVDKSRRMCALIQSNLDLCHVERSVAEVVQVEAIDYLRRVATRGRAESWDLIFFDPPYAIDYLPVLEFLGKHAGVLLEANGILIVEHHHKNSLPEHAGDLVRTRTLKQGDSALSFFKHCAGSSE